MRGKDAESEHLQALVSEGEHVHQDFKFAISDSRKIARSISAFANTEGGRLLIGIKDNGSIAGIKSEEEIYMIEAAATMYCTPPVSVSTRTYRVDGKSVLEVDITEASDKPVCAIDENGRPWAYVRIHDENIRATVIHLDIWKHNRKEETVVVAYTERERQVLEILKKLKAATLGRCCRESRISRKEMSRLLADFIRFGLVEMQFREHTFHFRLKESGE